jgi:hypothetical protein
MDKLLLAVEEKQNPDRELPYENCFLRIATVPDTRRIKGTNPVEITE